MVFNKKLSIPTTFELIKMVINLNTWKLKSPLQKWSYLYGIGRSLCIPLKMTAYQEDQTLSWFSYYPILYVSLHAVLVVYTALYYILHNEPTKFFPCTVLFGGPVIVVRLN